MINEQQEGPTSHFTHTEQRKRKEGEEKGGGVKGKSTVGSQYTQIYSGPELIQ